VQDAGLAVPLRIVHGRDDCFTLAGAMPSLPIDDYYELLGVDVGADDAALRQAWRRLAAQWHPDRAGVAATGRFQQIAAAYEVLSDPLARAAYDRRSGRGARSRASSAASAASSAAAPVRPARRSAPAVMLSRLCGPIDLLFISGAVRLDEPGYITLALRPEEAAQGGMITISMYVDLWCPACGGGRTRPAAGCRRCAGAGTVEELFSAWLAVPPGVGAGEVLVPSAELPGMVERVRFRVRVAG